MVLFYNKAKASTNTRANLQTTNSSNIPWMDIEALFKALDADVSERAGSRVAVVLFGEVRVFHRPHPSPNTDKGAIASIRKWFELYEVRP